MSDHIKSFATPREKQSKYLISRSGVYSPDPFTEHHGLIGRIKLSPIIVKERSSPVVQFPKKKISIKIPEVTSEGQFKLNHRFLFKQHPKIILEPASPALKSNSNQVSPMLDQDLKGKNIFFMKSSSEKGYLYCDNLDISFGK
jgi:hypothetical protein